MSLTTRCKRRRGPFSNHTYEPLSQNWHSRDARRRGSAIAASTAAARTPVVEIEEDVYTWTDADNGAGPMWCSGSTCLVSCQGRLFATALETMPGARPLNNCRWVLLEREATGWRRVRVDEGRTREPAPIAAAATGLLFVSTNPTLGNGPEPNGGPARPDLLEFPAADPSTAPVPLGPQWEGTPQFREHSYRSLASDGSAGEVVLFQNIDYTHVEWTFRDRGHKPRTWRLVWPWGADYERPQPIRVCYPTVALRDRAVHFFGVSDIFEPRADWRAETERLTGRHWDYDFRKLFYTWTPDITSGGFRPWIEVASREATCGWLSPADLWLGPDGSVHLLWTERAIDERLRKVLLARTTNWFMPWFGRERSSRGDTVGIDGGAPWPQPRRRFNRRRWPALRFPVRFGARFRRADGRRKPSDGTPAGRGRLLVVTAPLQHPFTSFFTATVRRIAALGDLDLLTSADKPNTIRYALRLPPPEK